MTPWGYEVEAMPPLVTVEQFNALTGGQYADDPRLVSALGAVSGLIRMACRWHVAPNIECTYTAAGGEKIIALPALAVTSVESVTEKGVELAPGQYEYRREGMLRRCGFKRWAPGWNAVTAVYKAGYDEIPAEVMEIAFTRVLAEISLPVGIRSETAGGVSISYATAGYEGGLSSIETMALLPYALPVEV